MVRPSGEPPNRIFDRLGQAGNVHVSDHARARSFVDHDLRVAIHDRSFGRADVRENVAAT